jgi:hypothetical protein
LIDARISGGKADHERLGTSAEFTHYVRTVRQANFRRSNLLAALDRAELP